MGIEQDYDDIIENKDIICPNCGSSEVVLTSYEDDLYLCTDCGQVFDAKIQKDDDF
ncbi:MAG TPA: TFIIB-type zinc ribbon-containing protein [Clostridia bacterium]